MRSTQQAIQTQRFGEYHLTAHLGRGGMADVFRARHVGAAGFQRTVVIKRILNGGDPDSIRMFINEAKLAAELSHPNIAQIYELGEVDGEFFIAMEYVRGKDLRQLLHQLALRKTPIPPIVACYIAREICRALAHAHTHTDSEGVASPIIHRDVSPANVVIAQDGHVKLVDFGVAKALYAGADQLHTQAGILKGKLGYMAPEQVEGMAVPQSDIFATGVVLYEMLTVRRLIGGGGPFDTLTKLKTMPFSAPSRIVAGISPVIDAIVLQALDRDLDARYASAGTMAKDLDHVVQAAGFSVENMAEFMREVSPPGRESESSIVSRPSTASAGASLGTQSTMSSAAVTPVRPPPTEEISISVSVTPAARTAIRRVALVGAVLAIALAGVYAASLLRRPGKTVAAAAAAAAPVAPPRSETAPPTTTPPSTDVTIPAGVRGVSDREIVLGMAAAISGPAKEYGRQMKVGIEAAFQAANERGGVNGRTLRLVTVDDGYEPPRTEAAMRELYERHQVLGVIGNTGTPTAAVAVPFALERKMLFFGAYSGAALLRRDPPDRYVFNMRASYGEETAAIVRYLVRVRHIRPEHIAVFAQNDAFGEAGYAGIAKAMRGLHPEVGSLFRMGYERNTIDVQQAVRQLRERPTRVRAVVMLALYRPAAKFVEEVRATHPGMLFITGSWVDSTALAEELKMLGPRQAEGVVVTQVVPSPESNSTAVLDFRAAMARHMPAERSECISLEGYLTANVLIEAMRRAGPALDTEILVDTLEHMRDFDLGIGTPISYSSSEHQGSHKVWGTRLDDQGRYQPIDLE
jgi:serine/threonine protein kinase/ABC-type branched-subunit amino acid transport system substrate-binding protein